MNHLRSLTRKEEIRRAIFVKSLRICTEKYFQPPLACNYIFILSEFQEFASFRLPGKPVRRQRH